MVKSLYILFMTVFTLTLKAQNYSIAELKIETTADVYSPVFYGDQLVVCSNQKTTINKTVLDANGGIPIDLYLIDPSSPSKLIPFSDQFKSEFHDGPIVFNDSLNLCVVSRNIIPSTGLKSYKPDKNLLGLFLSKKSGDTWGSLEAFPYNNSEYTISHPALSADGKILVFTSDMPGGYGGFDLWVSYYTTSWSKPENLGLKFNSSEDELFPSFNGDEIYFSSNKKGGNGGLDIYKSNLKSSSPLIRMDAPINSEKDDFGIIFKRGTENGYFSSNRNEIDKIYSFEFNYPEFTECAEIVNEDFCYTLFEENAAELTVVSLVYQWTINNERFFGIEIDYCFPGPGDYSISLDIIDTILKETYFNQAAYEMSLAYTEQAFISCPDTVKPGEMIEFSAFNSYLPNMENKTYYWDFGNDVKRKGILTNYAFEKEGVYTVRLGVIGTVDSLESRTCSYKTIVCTENYLQTNTYDLFSTKVPLDSNMIHIIQDSLTKIYSILLGMPDSVAMVNHPLYRHLSAFDLRMEFIEESGKYDYVIGRWTDINDAHESWKSLIDLGFRESIVRMFMKKDTVFFPIKKFFVVNDLNFDHNSWEIRPDAEVDLKRLIQILIDNPELTLEIAAHTDSEGPVDFNLRLSQNRALSVQNYLLKNNIDPKRITAKGFGESKPIADNGNELGKAKNRRVEFKLIIKKPEI